MQQPEKTAFQLLKGMNYISKIYANLQIDNNYHMQQFEIENFNRFIITIRSILNDLLNLSNIPSLKQESLKLVATLLSSCFENNYNDIHGKLLVLPDNVKDWPKTKSEIFFDICCLQIEGKRYVYLTINQFNQTH